MSDRISLAAKFAVIKDHWNPRIAAELNGQEVKLVKFQGAFDWHSHANEDELFFVHHGEFVIVPHGVEHRPVAEHECEVVLFEPAATRNTGNVISDRTRTVVERI